MYLLSTTINMDVREPDPGPREVESARARWDPTLLGTQLSLSSPLPWMGPGARERNRPWQPGNGLAQGGRQVDGTRECYLKNF